MKFFLNLAVLLVVLTPLAQSSDLASAIKDGEIDRVKQILKSSSDLLNKKIHNGMTPLNLAAAENEGEIGLFLLEAGADINICDENKHKPIHSAAKSGNCEILEALIAKGAKLEERDVTEMTPLLLAVSENRRSAMDVLIEKGADVNVKNNIGWSPILYAVILGSKYMTYTLLENQADVNVKANNGWTPMHSAASFGRSKVFKYLLEYGAEISPETVEGVTPLGLALNYNCLDEARTLIEKGADVNHQDNRGTTPLHGAAGRGTLKIVKLFVESGADVNAMDEGGWTPLTQACFSSAEVAQYLLSQGAKATPVSKKGIKINSYPIHMAAAHGKSDVVDLLMKHGADINTLNQRGESPLLMAINRGHGDLAKHLLEKGAKIDARKQGYDRNALHLAAIQGFDGAVDALLERGADIHAKDLNGYTALHYALYHSHKKIAKALVSKGADAALAKAYLSAPSLLSRPPQKKSANIWHLGHAGWAVQTKNHLLIFDYFKPANAKGVLDSGVVNPEELKDQNVIVFSTHEHGDHYFQGMFDWKNSISNIHYVLGHKPRGVDVDDYVYTGPRTETMVDGFKVTTIRSNDLGVGFLVEGDGITLFHAGDHANGDPAEEKIYKKEIDFVAKQGLDVDLAFFSIRGCGLGDPDLVKEGAVYAVNTIRPKVMFPQHAGDQFGAYLDYAKEMKGKHKGGQVQCVYSYGDRFVYKNGTVSRVKIDQKQTAMR